MIIVDTMRLLECIKHHKKKKKIHVKLMWSNFRWTHKQINFEQKNSNVNQTIYLCSAEFEAK